MDVKRATVKRQFVSRFAHIIHTHRRIMSYNTHTHMYTHMHARIHTHAHTYTHTYTHTHTHMHHTHT